MLFVKLAAVCWQPTGRKDRSLDNLDIKQGCFLSNLQLYVGNLQVVRTEVLTILTSNGGEFAKLGAVGWQPTGRKDGSLDNLDIKQGCFLSNLQLYVGNLQVVRREVLTILTSNGDEFVKLGAVGWQPTGRKDGSLDNLDIKRG